MVGKILSITKSEETMLVLGHTNPDCDSLSGSISLSAFLSKRDGKTVTPIMQGEPNAEGKFLLEQSGLPCPEIRTSIAGEEVWIIDYSDFNQAPTDARQAKIRGIVDHHKLGDFETDEQLEAWIWPCGCSNTIVYNMYKIHNIEIDKQVAVMMLGAILSDTVHFNSPTCTQIDIDAAHELAKIAGIEDIDAFVTAQFAAKSDIAAVPSEELILRDLKVYTIGDKDFSIAQIEITNVEAALSRKEELQAELVKYKAEHGYHTALVILTDITNLNSISLIESEEPALVAETLGGTFVDSLIDLPGVVSRKKQVLPPLQGQFK